MVMVVTPDCDVMVEVMSTVMVITASWVGEGVGGVAQAKVKYKGALWCRLWCCVGRRGVEVFMLGLWMILGRGWERGTGRVGSAGRVGAGGREGWARLGWVGAGRGRAGRVGAGRNML
ncbi:hypothetical protein E2C01_024245 [Portunus trituberculatus]|uniref:Uncharacterized protein n=1 Tax=Portunus trituberculatus TaxID=210409 RepID=A0A5B7EDB5_PORTR|nr:hypothetical protein [Portunus trituberculatus]